MGEINMMEYERPELHKLGSVEEVTRGQHFSNVDGLSGTNGNRGNGSP